MSSMGERIKKAREDKGLLQSQLAELIPVKSGGVISNWEKNINKPDADKIVRLCQVLDVSLSYLLNYYGEESPAQQELKNQAIDKLLGNVSKLTPENQERLTDYLALLIQSQK